MTDNPLIKKLRLQSGMRAAFVNPPDRYVESLAPSADVAIAAQPDETCDFIQIFVVDSVQLAEHVQTILGVVRPDCVLWFCYPKLSSGVQSDLTRDVGWEALYQAGWRGVASVAVDDVWSAVRFRPEEHDKVEDAFAAQYAGAKVALRPIYDRVLAVVQGFGDDVELQTRKTYVAFARGKQFAVVQPATKTRVDVGLKLPGVQAGGRLEPATNTGSGSMTHKVAVTSVDEVDEKLIDWLRKAYQATRDEISDTR
jgi:predicted transport protein